jgi:tRNA(Arg) A34 adenosine deaminase TadA
MLEANEILFLERAIELSGNGITEGKGGPFGCVIVREEKIIAEGFNLVTSTNDPTAHAEVVAIRGACKKLNSYELTDCDVYASCEPCPMCLGALYWARVRKVVYANTRHDAASIGFDDEFIYREINTGLPDRQIAFYHYAHPSAKAVFEQWKTLTGKRMY